MGLLSNNEPNPHIGDVDIDLPVLPFDLSRVLTGHPMVVTDPEGARVLLRLFEPEEFLGAQHESVDETGAPPENKIDLATAVSMTRPIGR